MEIRATAARVGCLGVCLLAIACALPRQAVAANERAASRPTVADARELAEVLATIRRADEPSAALAAYVRGLSLSPDSAELHRAHMRKMLQSGLPQAAWAPARRLVLIDPSDGTAWGVVGYTHARRNELPAAFSATMRAAERVTEDPGVMYNAGRLAAWLEYEPPAPVASEARAALQKHRQQWMQQEAFLEGFLSMEAVYADREHRRGEIDLQVQAAREELSGLETEARTIDAELRERNTEIGEIEWGLEEREEELDDVEEDLYDLSTTTRGKGYLRRRRRELRREIEEQEHLLEQKEAEVRRRRTEGQGVLDEYRRRRMALERMQADAERELARYRPDSDWKPPAVDGVVTPLRPMPERTSQPTGAPVDAEAHARTRVKLAELYLEHQLPGRAVEILRKLLRDYPQTEATARARELLSSATTQTTQPAE